MTFLAAVLLLAAAGRADDRVAAVTNRMAQIIDAGSYTFSVVFGRQGALELNGAATPTSFAFRVRLSGREMFRLVDQELWLPAAGTNGATKVVLGFPVHVFSTYASNRMARFTFGVLPPSRHDARLVADYGGVGERVASLPVSSQAGGHWRFCETNEAGTCIELGESPDPANAQIALLRTEEDKSAIFIHGLSVAAGRTADPATMPAALRTLQLKDFAVALTLCSDLALELHRAAVGGGTPEQAVANFGRHLDKAAGGLAGKMPPMPFPVPPRPPRP